MPSGVTATARARIGLDRLVEHLADPLPSGQRIRHLGQHVADQSQREHEQREQVDEAGQLADGDVAAAHPVGADDDEADVRERRQHVEDRLERPAQPDRASPGRRAAGRRSPTSRSVSRRSAPYALTSWTPSKLSCTPADSLPELALGGVEVLVDAPLVGDVGQHQDREHGDGDGAEEQVGGQQPDRRDRRSSAPCRWRTGSARARRSRRRCRRRRGRRGRRRGGAGATRSAGGRAGRRPAGRATRRRGTG